MKNRDRIDKSQKLYELFKRKFDKNLLVENNIWPDKMYEKITEYLRDFWNMNKEIDDFPSFSALKGIYKIKIGDVEHVCSITDRVYHSLFSSLLQTDLDLFTIIGICMNPLYLKGDYIVEETTRDTIYNISDGQKYFCVGLKEESFKNIIKKYKNYFLQMFQIFLKYSKQEDCDYLIFTYLLKNNLILDYDMDDLLIKYKNLTAEDILTLFLFTKEKNEFEEYLEILNKYSLQKQSIFKIICPIAIGLKYDCIGIYDYEKQEVIRALDVIWKGKPESLSSIYYRRKGDLDVSKVIASSNADFQIRPISEYNLYYLCKMNKFMFNQTDILKKILSSKDEEMLNKMMVLSEEIRNQAFPQTYIKNKTESRQIGTSSSIIGYANGVTPITDDIPVYKTFEASKDYIDYSENEINNYVQNITKLLSSFNEEIDINIQINHDEKIKKKYQEILDTLLTVKTNENLILQGTNLELSAKRLALQKINEQ